MAKVPFKPKKTKHSSNEELMSFNKEELIQRIIQLETHNTQLRNIISKNTTEESKTGGQKKFDYTKCHFRRVFLHIMYFGWDYQGLAVQEGTADTIEHHLFKALIKACLIESRETSQYHRCGRTDKGVSAFGQVISISLRSKHHPDEHNNKSLFNSELQYCKILNRLLPKDIRAVAWMQIPDGYSARFDCKKRQYKYYFPRSDLNITAMREACAHIVGSHDFRHLCKMDVGNGVTEFRREIFHADIISCDENDLPTSMYYLMIEGNAFLWHQIRCLMGVLILIGQGKEEAGVMKELLDVEKYPRKPQYNMALDLPLNLFHCSYEIENKEEWFYDGDELRSLIAHLQSVWTTHSIKTTMTREALQQLESYYERTKETDSKKTSKCMGDRVIAYTDCLLQGVKPKIYKPLLKRDTCSSLEERIEHYAKKRRLNNTENLENTNKEELKSEDNIFGNAEDNKVNLDTC